jgi:hypothetical protein
MSEWFQHIINAISQEQHEKLASLETLFHCIFLPKQKLVLHFISMDKVQHLPTYYFSSLTNEAKLQQLKCIHIWEDVYEQHPELVTARVLALIGNRQRVHARATQVKRIDKPTADLFLNKNHLQQSVGAYYKFGLYHHTELVAVATFSKSRMMQDGVVPYRSYELIRFASKIGVTVTGGLSKLLTFFIQEVNPAHIMTYTDRDWGTGEGFEKLGFTCIEVTEPIAFYANIKTLERLTLKQLPVTMQHDWIPIYNSGSNKFVLDRRNYTS